MSGFACVAAALLATMCASRAVAETGSGAERYEVTITPPKRPGTEAPVAAEPAAEAAAPIEDLDGNAAGVAAPPAVGVPSSNPPPAGTPPAAATASGTAPAAARAPEAATVPTGPLKSLQVGAFRAQKSAASLHEALSAKFTDVEIVEAQSGGEPIFRVNVGRLPRGVALEDLKKRLTAAGYPAFEVLAPPAN